LLALARHQLSEATERLAEARTFVEERKMQNYYPLIALAEGQVSAGAGRSDDALKQFALAESSAREMGMRPYLWQAMAGAANELSAAGRSAEAEEQRRQALDVINEIAADFADGDLQATFLRSARSKVSQA
jgi:hypothetical protein